jgi:hypothetical protein
MSPNFLLSGLVDLPKKFSCSPAHVGWTPLTSGTMAIDSTEQTLSKLFAPHVESFDYFLEEGLPAAIADLDPVYATFPNQKMVPSA